MNTKSSWSFVLASLILGCARAGAANPIEYSVQEVKVGGSKSFQMGVSIESIRLRSAQGVRKSSVASINSGIVKFVTNFAIEARQCGNASQGNPWEYKLSFDKIVDSRDYLSVVYNKDTVCAGSPEVVKEAAVFSKESGALMSPVKLVQTLLPKASVANEPAPRSHLIIFDRMTLDRMVTAAAALSTEYSPDCDNFAKTSSFRVWVDGRHLIAFPEFSRTHSRCQLEYSLDY
ncbi:hypothetical protein [Pseudoduganella buxea]|uniref:Uncharacterized protein n=1 Tax=Pseudoduganella buxea TaxID=1949069 RepID=A0A6I3SXW8_9BURK|nr:hypothetical protein [Pseudoduganella buxea]MTV54181.1 hypothetical protein [Pseudoduganella buxea]GGC15189.1 hypothetical protein GCM10011572_40680 [Pseudoduganella buxea]